jgi:hypothetical protein
MTYHMSIRMTPFRALYKYDATSFMEIVFGDSRASRAKDWIEERHKILKKMKENLQATQKKKNIYAYRQRVECNFEVGDLVFLILQSYINYSMKNSGAEKLKPWFYGLTGSPKGFLRCLDIPKGSNIHNVFHVSNLNKEVGQHITTSEELPPLNEEGQLELVPNEVLENKECMLRS